MFPENESLRGRVCNFTKQKAELQGDPQEKIWNVEVNNYWMKGNEEEEEEEKEEETADIFFFLSTSVSHNNIPSFCLYIQQMFTACQLYQAHLGTENTRKQTKTLF